MKPLLAFFLAVALYAQHPECEQLGGVNQHVKVKAVHQPAAQPVIEVTASPWKQVDPADMPSAPLNAPPVPCINIKTGEVRRAVKSCNEFNHLAQTSSTK
jgi:hypothetical protein